MRSISIKFSSSLCLNPFLMPYCGHYSTLQYTSVHFSTLHSIHSSCSGHYQMRKLENNNTHTNPSRSILLRHLVMKLVIHFSQHTTYTEVSTQHANTVLIFSTPTPLQTHTPHESINFRFFLQLLQWPARTYNIFKYCTEILLLISLQTSHLLRFGNNLYWIY